MCLVAAFADDIVRSLLGAQMLAPHLPTVCHRDHAVERGAPPPRGSGGMRALALEHIFDADHAGAVGLAPGGRELTAAMSEDARARERGVEGEGVTVRVYRG